MNKLFAVIKREYIQRVRTKFFVIATILGPLMMAAFTVVPALLIGIRAGGPTRLAIVDQTGTMYSRVARELTRDESDDESQPTNQTSQPERSNPAQRTQPRIGRVNFAVEEVPIGKTSVDDLRRDLNLRVQDKDLDGYLILPANLLEDGQPELRARNTADLFTKGQVESAI